MYNTGGRRSYSILYMNFIVLSLCKTKENVYLQVIQQLKQSLNGEVAIMGELTTVNHHHGTMSMCSDTSDVCLQGTTTCHHLRIGDDVGNVGLVLIHPIDDDTQVFAGILLTLSPMVGILLPLTPFKIGKQQYAIFNHTKVLMATYFSSCMCLSKISLSHFLTVGLRVLSRASLMAAHTSHLENLLSLTGVSTSSSVSELC